MPASTRSSRQQILETAAALFFRDGFRAVGIDTIVAESGIGKMTLYRYFPSKDELIVAYLNDTNDKFWVWFNEAADPFPNQPARQILAVFQAQETLVKSPKCYGCPFLNAVVDFPDPSHPGHQVAVQHKRSVQARFEELAKQAAASDPKRLAEQLLMLMDGAFMAVRMFGPDNPAAHVAEAAATLIKAQGFGAL